MVVRQHSLFHIRDQRAQRPVQKRIKAARLLLDNVPCASERFVITEGSAPGAWGARCNFQHLSSLLIKS